MKFWDNSRAEVIVKRSTLGSGGVMSALRREVAARSLICLHVGPYSWLIIFHPQPILNYFDWILYETLRLRIAYSCTIGCIILSEYIPERPMKISSVLLAEPSITILVPRTSMYTMSPVMKFSHCSRNRHDSNIPYCLHHLSKVSHWHVDGMSRRFPMIGSPFGPGGKGRPREGRQIYNQVMVHSKAPTDSMYCQLLSITMGDPKTRQFLMSGTHLYRAIDIKWIFGARQLREVTPGHSVHGGNIGAITRIPVNGSIRALSQINLPGVVLLAMDFPTNFRGENTEPYI